MSRTRSYKLGCSIARALDRVGDRWTLLILRDLHAGPARFSELLAGLPGLATNLLTTRLQQLMDDGLVARQTEPDHSAPYYLTEAGLRTDELLFSLAQFGGHFQPPPMSVKQHNYRMFAITLKVALRQVMRKYKDCSACLQIDESAFDIKFTGEMVDVFLREPTSPDVRLQTALNPFLRATDGRMDGATFMTEHCTIEGKDRLITDWFSVTFENMLGAIRA